MMDKGIDISCERAVEAAEEASSDRSETFRQKDQEKDQFLEIAMFYNTLLEYY